MTVPLSVCIVVKLYIISIVLLSGSEVGSGSMLVDIIRNIVYAFIGMSCIIAVFLICY